MYNGNNDLLPNIRELSLTEVQEVSGGNWLIKAIVAIIVTVFPVKIDDRDDPEKQ